MLNMSPHLRPRPKMLHTTLLTHLLATLASSSFPNRKMLKMSSSGDFCPHLRPRPQTISSNHFWPHLRPRPENTQKRASSGQPWPHLQPRAEMLKMSFLRSFLTTSMGLWPRPKNTQTRLLGPFLATSAAKAGQCSKRASWGRLWPHLGSMQQNAQIEPPKHSSSHTCGPDPETFTTSLLRPPGRICGQSPECSTSIPWGTSETGASPERGAAQKAHPRRKLPGTA